MNQDVLNKKLEQLILACGALKKTILSFERILEKEVEAVGRSEIKELDVITQEKIFFGQKVEEFAQEIRRLLLFFESNLDLSELNGEHLQIESLIDQLRSGAKFQKIPIVDLDIQRLEKAVQELRQARMHIFPKIEANAYMVKKLLQYHRETHAFWQAVAHDSEAVYGKSGRTLGGSQKSLLTVRT
jgi:flagellar biosynthesis/type III secretory pathway chaperone